jgi:hypothetical protein
MAQMPTVVVVKLVTRYGAVSWWRMKAVVFVAKVLRVPLDVVEDA